MTPLERRVVSLLASVYGFRILGLFLILPVFAVYAGRLTGHTPLRVGLALGIYGLSQALLQIPSGLLSDRIGRKPVIVLGLLVFAAGSAVAAMSTSIYGVIAGRALQGAGAISAAIMALAADLTREEQRTKAMAVIGITIGGGFMLAMLLSPVLDSAIGVRGIFWLTAALALVAVAVVLLRVPTPAALHRQAAPTGFRLLLADRNLLRLDAGIFALHLVMTGMFVVLPPLIVHRAGLPLDEHWKLYLPVMLLALVGMAPFVRARAGATVRPKLVGAALALIIAELVYRFFNDRLAGIAIGLWLFFTAFSVTESILPSLVSRMAPVRSRGAAIGIYSTSQFLGAFIGGAGGGYLAGRFGPVMVFDASAAVLGVWLLLSLMMPEPRLLATHLFRMPSGTLSDPGIGSTLSSIAGVVEVMMVPEEGIAYLRVDPALFNERDLDSIWT
ncbi:MAG: MFS transporter [Acidiferrobacteraceae bacterium]